MSDVDPTINGVGGEGFAVDGTDSFAVDPELPPDEPAGGPPPNRRGLFLTLATGLALLLVVVIAGSAGGDDQAGLRGEDVETSDPERSTTTTDRTDETDPEPDTEKSEAISGDDLRSPGGATIEFDDETTLDTTFDQFEDFDEFDDDFSLDDFDLGEYEDEFDDFTDEDDFSGTGGGRYLPRRVPYVPSTRRPTTPVPPWYRPTTPTTDPDDTEPEDESTTTASTVATTAATTAPTTAATTAPTTAATTAPTTAPPQQGSPWEQATCASGLGLWGTASGQLVSVPGVGVWTFADVAGPFTAVSGEVGTGPHRTFAADPFDGTRGWLVDSTGVLRQLAGGAVTPVTGAPPDVHSLSVHVASAGAAPTMLVAAGQPAVLERLPSGSTEWVDVPALPNDSGTIRHVQLVDAVTLLVSTDKGVYRRQGTDAWTLEHSDAVVGEPVVSQGVISWLVGGASGVDGVIRSTNGGQDWQEMNTTLIAPTASRIAALADGRVVTVGSGTNLVASPATIPGDWTTHGPALPYPSAEVAGVVRVPNVAATFIVKAGCGPGAVARVNDP